MADASGLGHLLYESGFPLYGRRAYLGQNERLRLPATYSDLTAEGLSITLQKLQRGECADWADLVQYALKDDLFVQLYVSRVVRVAQADYQIVPNEFGDPALSQLAAQFIHENLARVENWDDFVRNLLHAIALGYSANEIEWDRDGVSRTVFARNIHYINPNRFRYDEQWKLRLYDHGTKSQKARSQYGEPLWPGSWVVHHHHEIAGDPCDAGLMRMCIWRWLFRRWADTFWITSLEKYGSPWIHAKVAPNTPDEVRQRIKENLIDLNIERAAVIETGGELVVTPPAMGTGSASQHELYMDFCKESLTATWLGASDVSSPGENGSQAAVSGRISATTDPRMVTDGMNLCGTLHEQLFRWMLIYNKHRFGGQMPPVPKMQFKTASDEQKTDGQDLATQTAADANGYGTTPPGAPYEVRGDAASPSLDGTLALPPSAGVDQYGNPLEFAADGGGMSLPPGMPPPPQLGPGAPAQIAPPPPPEKPTRRSDSLPASGQIDSLLKIARAVTAGEIPRSTGVGIISYAFGVDHATADAILAEAMGPAMVAQAPQPFDPYAPQPDPLVDPQQLPPGDTMLEQQPAQADPYHPPAFQPEGAPPSASPLHQLSEQDELQLGANPDPITPDEEAAIADIVAQYRSGQLQFTEALSAIAETSLSWKEAQILLADAAAAPAMSLEMRRAIELKFNPGQPRDESGKWTDGASAVGSTSGITAEQSAKFQSELAPDRRAAIDRIGSAAAAKPPASPTASAAPGATQTPSTRISSELSHQVFGRHVSDNELDELIGKNAMPEGYSLQTNAKQSKRAFQHLGDLELSGTILDKSGQKCGEVIRYYKREPDGSLTVKNHEFFIDDAHQGSGLGKALFNSQMDAYEKQGVSKTKLEAGFVGRYVWTKAGFEWDDKEQSARVLSQFGDHLSSKYGPDTAAKIMSQVKTPYDMSRVSVGNERVGKDFLVNLPDDEQINMSQAPSKVKRL